MTIAPTLFRTLESGVRLRCPHCGVGKLFSSYLKRRDACDNCGESFAGLDADDGPAWLTIGVAAHIVIPLLIFLERDASLSYPAELMIVVLATIALVLLILPLSKGFFLAFLWWTRAVWSN